MNKFNLGKVVFTSGISNIFSEFEISDFIGRHMNCDFGDLCESDRMMNENAVKFNNDQVFSEYNHEKGKVWVITEWDRSVTTVLLPSEY